MSQIDQALTYSRSSYWVLLTLEVTQRLHSFQTPWQAMMLGLPSSYSHSSLGTVLSRCGRTVYILSVRAFDVGDTIIVNRSRQRK
jgi:hypothetical protein